MSYPGNPSLADEIQQKILGTFLQTLDLAEQGKREEALLGCDFIRRLDPLFEPAETLSVRLGAQEGAVPVADLRTQIAAKEDLAAQEETLPIVEQESAAAEVEELFAALDESKAADALSSFELGESDVEPGPPGGADGGSPLGSLGEQAEPPAPEPRQEPEPDPTLGGSSSPAPEPAAALDRESEERVQQLLSEGQAAFEQAEYQSAIDAWSRIFLIDIDHPEANRRIELARKLKAEVERKVEELYHDALTAIEGGSLEMASEGLRKVLHLQPSHLAAQEHLHRLTAGDFLPEDDTGAAVEATDLGPIPATELDGGDFPAEEIPESEFGFEPLTPPSLETYPEDTTPADAPRPLPSRRPSRYSVLVIAGLVLVVAVIAAWFLRSNWTRFFPNAGEEAVAPLRPTVDPIVRAQGLHLAGNTAMAISQLRRLPPAHPQYAEAQALIAQWETVLEEDTEEGPSEEELALRDEFVAQAREAFANRELLSAEEYFTLAAQAAPLEEGEAALQTETLERLEPLRSEIDIFRQGEWAYALRSLWQKYEADPGNPDVLRLMVDGYYNLGVRDLQRGDPLAATENLTEAASLAGSDPEIQRLLDFASVYAHRQPDLLYRIFVKYLPFR